MQKFHKLLSLGLLLLSITLTTGCASVPMAGIERDNQSKTFAVKPGKSNVYIYRNEAFASLIKIEVLVDGFSVGETVAYSYIALELPPGKHTLVSKAETDSTLELVTEEGKNYFVWQEAKMGQSFARSRLQLVNENRGRAGVEECSLIDHAQPVYSNLPSQTSPAMSSAAVSPSSLTKMDIDLLPSVTVTTKRNAYAVVIGIEQYREKLPKADFADRDAKLMGEYLTKVLGFPEENVVTMINEKATKTDLEKYLETWLPNNVEPGSNVFVYYSGHGTPYSKTGEAYLVPYDGDPSFMEATSYPLKRLYATLNKLPAKEITVVLDSCFSGAGGRSVLAKGTKPMMLSVENPWIAGSKTIVLTASSGDQISSTYEEKGHGLLTYYFLKGLQGEGDLNKDGAIDMGELYEYVKPNVKRVARKQYNQEQTPQLLGNPEMIKVFRLVEKTSP